MALALDGHVHATLGGGSPCTTPTLTCSGATNIIYVVVTANGIASNPPTISSSPSLTWVSRSALVLTGGTKYDNVWYAVTSSAFSGTISIAQVSSTFIGVDAFGISGADTVTIFDSHAGLPINTNTGDPINVSTTNANDFIVASFREVSTSTPTAGSGWTQISGADFMLTEYQIVSSAQTNLSCTQTTGAGNSSGEMVDAIIAASAVQIEMNVHTLGRFVPTKYTLGFQYNSWDQVPTVPPPPPLGGATSNIFKLRQFASRLQ